MKKLMIILLALLLVGCTGQQTAEVTEETQQKVEAVTRQTTEPTTEEETTDDADRQGSDFIDDSNTACDDNPGTDDNNSGADRLAGKTAEELAYEASEGVYGNGEERKQALGDRYDEVQRLVDEMYSIEVPTYVYDDTTYVYQPDTGVYYGDGALNPESGVNYYGGVLETYYDLDMSWCIGVMRDMGYDEVNYPYWIRSDGVKMLGDYVMCAADFGYEPRGTITSTSLGTAIVVDTGLGGWGWHDICVSGW